MAPLSRPDGDVPPPGSAWINEPLTPVCSPRAPAGTARTGAAALGPSLGYWFGRRRVAGTAVRDRLPGPARRMLALASARPGVAVATGQWFAVSRTLAPRLAGRSMSYGRFALHNVPVAVAWATATFTLGRLVVDGSELAARVLSAQQVVGTVLLVALVVVVTVVVVRGRRTPQAGTDT